MYTEVYNSLISRYDIFNEIPYFLGSLLTV